MWHSLRRVSARVARPKTLWVLVGLVVVPMTAQGQGPALAPALAPAGTANAWPAPAQSAGEAVPLYQPSAAPGTYYPPPPPAQVAAVPPVASSPAPPAIPQPPLEAGSVGVGAGGPPSDVATELPAEPAVGWQRRIWPFSLFSRASTETGPALPSTLAEPPSVGSESLTQSEAALAVPPPEGAVVPTLPPAEEIAVPATDPTADPAAVPAADAAAEVPPGAAAPATVIVEPPPKLWTGNFDVGLNGSDGNSQVFNIRLGSIAIRETAYSKLTLKTNYLTTSADGVTTADRLFFDGRHEWLRPQSPWTIFVQETTEYDEFTAFDVRVMLSTGLGYQFIKNDITTLTGRFGPGVSREFGGPDDRWIPELVFGGAFERQLSTRQKLIASVDYFPDVTNFADFRVNSQGAWQISLNEADSLSLKLSVTDRYDSTPNGARPNDIDYATTLVWSY